MKMRNLFAAAAAVAVAAATSVSVFAASFFVGTNADKSGSLVCLTGEAIDNPMFADITIPATITKCEVTIKITEDYDFFKEEVLDNAESWYGGAFCVNCDSLGWAQTEWNFNANAGAPLTWVAGANEGEFVLTVDNGAPFFATTDTYAFFHIHDWTSTYEFEVIDYKLLNAAGEDVRVRESAGSAGSTGSADAGKGSSDTGVEGIAVVAGVAALAGAAVVVSRKRK